MRAATIRDGEVLVAEHPDPEPGAGEVLVRVRAAGLNGADMLQRRGAYPAPPGSPPDIPGLELAGEVAALGPGAQRFSEGDRVMAIVGGGTAGWQRGRAAGAHVTATVRNEQLRDAVRDLGAHEVLAPDAFADRGPYDVVLELVGAPNIPDSVNALNTLGRIAVIGVAGGFKAELNLLALMGKRGSISSSPLRSPP